MGTRSLKKGKFHFGDLSLKNEQKFGSPVDEIHVKKIFDKDRREITAKLNELN